MNLNEMIRDAQEEQYLSELAKKFVSNREKNFTFARSIIMDIHLSLEFIMNFGIAHVCTIGGKNIKGIKNRINPSEVFETIADLNFSIKIKIVDKLRIFSPTSISILIKINKVRNAFAHGYDLRDRRYKYNGNSIMLKRTIDRVISDRKKTMDDFFKGSFEKI